MPGFEPPTRVIPEKAIWSHKYFNELLAYLQTFLSDIPGEALEAPLVLAREAQHLDGQQHYIRNFARWFGNAQNSCVRDVIGFGAAGTGSVDDSVAIQKAIDEISVDGGIVLFPPGIYRIDKTINMAGSQFVGTNPKNRVVFVGCGSSTVIKLGAGIDLPMINMGGDQIGMAIWNLRIDGNQSNQTVPVDGVVADNTIDATIEGVYVQGCSGSGITVGSSTNLSIRGCWLLNNTEIGIEHGAVTPATGLLIDRCIVINGDGDGIRLAPVNGAIISRCIIAANAGHGIFIGSADQLNVSTVNINECSIFQCGTDETHNGIAIKAAHNGARVEGIIVKSNFVGECTGDGILIQGEPYAAIRAIAVTANIVFLCARDGIKFYKNVVGATCGSNTCYNNGSEAAHTAAGVHCIGIDSDGEVIGVAITANTCFDDQGGSATQNYGIWLDANSKNCSVIANPVFGNLTAQILDSGEDNDVGHNPGF